LCISWGVSWWRKTEMLAGWDDRTRLALISMDAGGGSGTAWPAWLYDDNMEDIPIGFYG